MFVHCCTDYAAETPTSADWSEGASSKSPLALLPSLEHPVWVGLSAGSMVMTPKVGKAFIEMKPPITGEDRVLGIVDFSLFPRLDHPGFDENTMACAEKWATDVGGPAYAIDDQTAIQVVDGEVEVISEGNWRRFSE